MKIFYSPAHLRHHPAEEFEHARLGPAVEVPERAESVRRRLEERKLGPILAPSTFGDQPIAAVHDNALIAFLKDAHARWRKTYGEDSLQALPSAWPGRATSTRRRGNDIEAELGHFGFDTATPILRGTFEAARAAIDVSLSAAEALHAGERASFALTRPPGHHASSDVYGGYCYFNNVAVAAQWHHAKGRRVAILDVDYHHGNGTQAIFYDRPDVLFVSIHADPSFAFPHFSGFADETGRGEGEGANLNLPLPAGTDWARYSDAVDAAFARIQSFGADTLLVSLGLDTFKDDPIARFELGRDDYFRMGKRIASLALPTQFNFEGGYNLEAIGEITVNVLEGFLGG